MDAALTEINELRGHTDMIAKCAQQVAQAARGLREERARASGRLLRVIMFWSAACNVAPGRNDC